MSNSFNFTEQWRILIVVSNPIFQKFDNDGTIERIKPECEMVGVHRRNDSLKVTHVSSTIITVGALVLPPPFRWRLGSQEPKPQTWAKMTLSKKYTKNWFSPHRQCDALVCVSPDDCRTIPIRCWGLLLRRIGVQHNLRGAIQDAGPGKGLGRGWYMVEVWGPSCGWES